MENASKALIMAGSVLIALLVIGALVLFYNNLTKLQAIEHDNEAIAQAAEFNKQFEAYNRDVYGSELLSLVNKVADYKKRESDENRYTEIELEITLTDRQMLDEKLFNKKTYSGSDFYDIINKEIETKVKTYSSRDTKDEMIYTSKNKLYSRTIAQLAEMRTNEWMDLLGLDEDKDTIQEIKEKIANYEKFKSLKSTINQMIFECSRFEYDEHTGRVTKMKYKQK